MTLQASGAISLSDLRGEFGGSAPDSLSEYYRGGSLVPDIAANAGIPTSGAISLSDFYGGQAINYNITPAGGGGYGFGGPVAGYFTFHADGTTTYANGLLPDGTGQWIDGAPISGIGTGRYIRLVTSAGVLDGPGSLSAGTWYQLDADRYFAVTTEGAPDFDEWTGTVEIGEDGSTALYSVAFAISAQSDTI